MKLLFYADWPPAVPYLEPLYLYFEKQGHSCRFFISQTTVPNQVVAALLKLQGYEVVDKMYRYDYAFCTDTRSACPPKNRFVIHHGMASKSQDFSKQRAGRNKGIDVVPSQWFYEAMRDRQRIPESNLLIGGLSKWDTFKNPPPLRKKKPQVVYLPTHNAQLTSIEILGERIHELPHLEHRHHAIITGTHLTTPNYECCFGPDRSMSMDNLLWNSDIVIADMGSTVIEGLALGKMVIQVMNPEASDFHFQKGTTQEEFEQLPEVYFPGKYGWRVSDMDGVHEAISRYEWWLENRSPIEETIVENIGNWGFSKVIERAIS